MKKNEETFTVPNKIMCIDQFNRTHTIQVGDRIVHFKGNIYTIMSFCLDANDPTRILVAYKDISKDENPVWIRYIGDLFDPIDKDKYPDYKGKQKTRFVEYLKVSNKIKEAFNFKEAFTSDVE